MFECLRSHLFLPTLKRKIESSSSCLFFNGDDRYYWTEVRVFGRCSVPYLIRQCHFPSRKKIAFYPTVPSSNQLCVNHLGVRFCSIAHFVGRTEFRVFLFFCEKLWGSWKSKFRKKEKKEDEEEKEEKSRKTTVFSVSIGRAYRLKNRARFCSISHQEITRKWNWSSHLHRD